jgi:hypothetical protein
MKGMRDDTFLRTRLNRRLRQKRWLNALFVLTVGGPFLILFILGLQGQADPIEGLDRRWITGWLGTYLILTLFHWRLWRCPKCEKGLDRFWRHSFAIQGACRHCGLKLLPREELGLLPDKRGFTLRRGFVVFIITVAGALFFLSLQWDVPELRSAAVATLALLGLVAIALKRGRAKGCKKCGALNQGPGFCEQCGEKVA